MPGAYAIYYRECIKVKVKYDVARFSFDTAGNDSFVWECRRGKKIGCSMFGVQSKCSHNDVALFFVRAFR